LQWKESNEHLDNCNALAIVKNPEEILKEKMRRENE